MSIGRSWIGGNSLPDTITLTDVPSVGVVFQRTAGATTGSITISGTYTGNGGVPSPEGQVRKVSDNSIVLSWTTLQSITEGGGTWSGKIPAVDQGGAYKVEVRCGGRHDVKAAGSNSCWVGAVFLMYGQSNMGVMTHNTNGSPASPNAATRYYGVSPVDTTLGWQTVPPGNGIINLLNGLNTLMGVPVAAANAAIPATGASFLINTNWVNIISLMQAMTGGDFEGIFWNQGENNSNGSTANLPEQTQAEYLDLLRTLQTNAMTLTGRTSVQVPILLSSLSTQKPPDVPTNHNSTFWPQQQRTLALAGGITDITYSHSRTFAAMGVDGLHINGDDTDKIGKIFAHDMAVVKGVGSGISNWSVTSASVTDATHTAVTVTHSLGTDFTPTSGIVGFEVSGDGGATWITPSAAVRTNATTITLTHSSLTQKSRLIRYMWDWTPWSDVNVYAANVYDNSTNAVPLGNTPDWIMCSTGSQVAVPTLCLPQPRTSLNQGTLIAATATQIGIGAASSDRLIIVSVMQTGTLPTSVTVTPYAGDEINPGSSLTPVSLTKVSGGATGCTIWKGIVANGLSCLIAAQYPSNPFSSVGICAWRAASSLMNSTTPVDAQNVAFVNGASSATLNVQTSADGFVIACSAAPDLFAVFSGTEAYAQDFPLPVSGFQTAHSAVNSANASSAVTVTMPTFTATTSNTLVATSWR